jgi:hypothetical protein
LRVVTPDFLVGNLTGAPEVVVVAEVVAEAVAEVMGAAMMLRLMMAEAVCGSVEVSGIGSMGMVVD